MWAVVLYASASRLYTLYACNCTEHNHEQDDDEEHDCIMHIKNIKP